MTEAMSLGARVQAARTLLYPSDLEGDPVEVAERYREQGADMEAVLCAIALIFAAEEGQVAESEETVALIDRLVERARS